MVEHHEQMNFVYLTQREEEDGDHDEAGSKLALNTVERRDDVAEEQEVLIYKDRQDRAQNAMRMKLGAAPGQFEHDEYQGYG